MKTFYWFTVFLNIYLFFKVYFNILGFWEENSIVNSFRIQVAIVKTRSKLFFNTDPRHYKM